MYNGVNNNSKAMHSQLFLLNRSQSEISINLLQYRAYVTIPETNYKRVNQFLSLVDSLARPTRGTVIGVSVRMILFVYGHKDEHFERNGQAYELYLQCMSQKWGK